MRPYEAFTSRRSVLSKTSSNRLRQRRLSTAIQISGFVQGNEFHDTRPQPRRNSLDVISLGPCSLRRVYCRLCAECVKISHNEEMARLSTQPLTWSVPEKREEDDDRDRDAEQPKKNSSTHDMCSL